jgi:hypothetical protein
MVQSGCYSGTVARLAVGDGSPLLGDPTVMLAAGPGRTVAASTQ